MNSDRIERMKELVQGQPEDARARYFLAHELFRLQDWAGAAEQYAEYLRLEPRDEGSGYRNYGACLERLGRGDEAAHAYRMGIESAIAHRHDGLAAEIQELLDAVET